jgi:methionyl-tRNA synthetase
MIWQRVSDLDGLIQKEQPFKKIKIDKEAGENDLKYLLKELLIIVTKLEEIMPETSNKMKEILDLFKVYGFVLFTSIYTAQEI